MNRFLPVPASSHAGAIDGMLLHVHEMMLVLFAGWSIYFIYVLIRYRAVNHPHADREGTRGRLAVFIFAGVVVAEAALLIGSALPLWYERTQARPVPGTPVVIRIVAEQFVWNVHYAGADGQFGDTSLKLIAPDNAIGLDRSSRFGKDDLVFQNEIHLPIGRAAIIELSSKDVIHSFGIPAMRVKQDAVPGLRSSVWFTPTLAGDFDVACSQLCGTGHYRMRAVITVESENAFRKFLADEAKTQTGR